MTTVEQRMQSLVNDFVSFTDYNIRHDIIKQMAALPDRDNVAIHESLSVIVFYYAGMLRFGLQHARRHPTCPCMDDLPSSGS